MEDIVLRKLRQLAGAGHMLPPGSRVLAAVSGGADSMCLLHALLTLRASLDITVAAAHFNHQLRPEAEAEERFVRAWCAEHEVPCHTKPPRRVPASRRPPVSCATPFWRMRRNRPVRTESPPRTMPGTTPRRCCST